jgi:hypothetical protein
MNLRAAKKIKYGQSAQVTSVPTLFLFYSVVFYSICVLRTLTSQALLSKAVLLTPYKHGQKLQLCFIMTF